MPRSRLAALLLAVCLVPAAHAATFTVTTNALGGAPGSLYVVLAAANANPGLDTIVFNLPPAERTITLPNPLPNITDPVILDATTNPGWSLGAPVVEIVRAAGNPYGQFPIFTVAPSGAGSTIRGFIVDAIRLRGRTVVAGNWLGLTRSGMRANSGTVRVVSDGGSTIGGTVVADRNYFAGYAQLGKDDVFIGNYYGLTVDGSSTLPLIAGAPLFEEDFLELGWSPLPPAPTNIRIGGPTLAERNLFGGETTVQSYHTAAGGTIQNNWFRLAANGTPLPPATKNAIVLFGDPGGAPFVVTGNTIHAPNGVVLLGQSVVQNNSITVQPGGTGIYAGTAPQSASNSTISGNTISGGRVGVVVEDPAKGVSILNNSIFGQSDRGISLAGTTPLPNDAAPDADTGGNDLQNYPVLTTATLAGTTLTVTGTLTSAPLTPYTVELFANATAVREGKRRIAAATVTTDALGNAPLLFTVPVSGVTAGEFVTSTATNTAVAPTPGNTPGSTSEFSAPLAVTQDADVTVSSTIGAPSVATGSTVTLNVTVANNGPSPAANVVATIAVPPSLSIVSATPSQGSCSGGVCSLGTVATGASPTIAVVLQPAGPPAGPATLTTSVTSSTPDPNGANNTSTANVVVNPSAIPLLSPLAMAMLAAALAMVALRMRS